jgi:hypothetical protein
MPCLRSRRKPGAVADEVEMKALENAALLVVETAAVATGMQRVDAPEHPRMGVDAVLVAGEQGRQLKLDLLQRGRGLARRQVAKERDDAGEVASGAVERGDRVGERRRVALAGDRVELGEMLAHRHGEGRCEVLGAHLRERRQTEGPGPGRKQRVGHFLPRWMSPRSRSS